MKITSKMTINELLKNYPKSAQVFRKFNMHCLGCKGAHSERLDLAAMAHGVDVDELIMELNKVNPVTKSKTF